MYMYIFLLIASRIPLWVLITKIRRSDYTFPSTLCIFFMELSLFSSDSQKLEQHLARFSSQYDQLVAFKPTGWTFSQQVESVGDIQPDVSGNISIYGMTADIDKWCIKINSNDGESYFNQLYLINSSLNRRKNSEKSLHTHTAFTISCALVFKLTLYQSVLLFFFLFIFLPQYYLNNIFL